MGRTEEQAWPGQAAIGVLLEALGLLGEAGEERSGKQLGYNSEVTEHILSK